MAFQQAPGTKERNTMSDEIRLKERMSSQPETPAAAESTPMIEPPAPVLGQTAPPPPSPPTEMSLVHYLDEPLWRVKGWIQLMGILFMLNGILMVLSLWGILLCWLPFWLGLTLMSAAKNIRAAAEFNDQRLMRMALDKLGLYFKINGILIVLGLVFGILAGVAVALGVLGSAAMMNQGMHNMIQ
jgi:hypothetical protein